MLGGLQIFSVRPVGHPEALQICQEPRKGGFSKGGFCRVQCHGQGNKEYPRILAPAVDLALRAPQPREAYILKKPPSKNPLFSASEYGGDSAVPKRGRSKHGRTQKHANEHRRAQMSTKERKRKSAKECKKKGKSLENAKF